MTTHLGGGGGGGGAIKKTTGPGTTPLAAGERDWRRSELEPIYAATLNFQI